MTAHRTWVSPTDSSDAVQALVAKAREQFPERFADPQRHVANEFDAPDWEIHHLRTAQGSKGNANLAFRERNPTGRRSRQKMPPLPPHFAEVVKAWVVLEAQGIADMGIKTSAMRLLWESLKASGKAERFRWEGLRDRDFDRAEQYMKLLKMQDNTIHSYAKEFPRIASFVQDIGGVYLPKSTVEWVKATALPMNVMTADERKERADALEISDAMIRGLGRVYRETQGDEDADRYLLLVVALLFVTGLRIGELVHLPVDCFQEWEENGEERFAIRFWNEKTGGTERLWGYRDLTPLGAALAKLVILELQQLTATARDRARMLEAQPGRAPLPGYSPTDELSTSELARALGYKTTDGFAVYARSIGLRATVPRRGAEPARYRVSDVEAALAADRTQEIVFEFPNGQVQRLSETLLISWRYFFHAGRGVSPIFVDQLTDAQIQRFLGGSPDADRYRVKSLFERYDIREENGTICRVHSHQFRHWLNDTANREGMSEYQVTLWFGRKSVAHTRPYLKSGPEVLRNEVRARLAKGELAGPKAEMFNALPTDRREAFLNGIIQAAQYTPIGWCVRNFSVTPCDRNLACVGCFDYLHTKNDPEERAALDSLEKKELQAIADIAVREAAGKPVLESYKRMHEEKLADIRQIKAGDDDASIEDGAAVQPFADRPTRFEPL